MFELIQSFGFPVAVAIGCGWFIYTIYTNQAEQNKYDKERMYEVLAQANATNESILKANDEILMSNRELMKEIKIDISTIKNAVVK